MAKELITRDQVKEEDTWKVSDIYESVELWEADLKLIAQLASEIASFEGKVCENAKSLLTVLDKAALMAEKLDTAYNYAQRLFDQDQGNTKHQAMSAKVMSTYADCMSKVSFVDPEILACEESKIEEFMAQEKGLELYRLQIKEIQRLKPHTLSAELEKVAAMTAEMRQSPDEIYCALTNVDMTFGEIKDEDDELIRLTEGRYIHLLESPDRRVRKDAFTEYYRVYKQFLNTIAASYNAQVKTQCFNSKLRGYGSNLEAAVDANNVDPQVYRNLLDTIEKNVDKLHRYVRLRKKCLGVDELHMYDIYTPMIAGVAKDISVEEAKDTVLKALAPLGEDYVALLQEAFDNRWIDWYENQGKRGGAYSSGSYSTHPFVLMNYDNSLDKMFTLAHEMGHALHSYFSNKTQPYIYSEYKIFVAEVASTTNEILLMEYLLERCADDKERAYLLNHYLDGFKGTVFRQTQFAEFEMKTNAMVEAGEGLNAENLSTLYKEINEKYYGPDMVSDEEIAFEWARIPHFYYNFYVYQYATSYCAAQTIAHDILAKGAPAVEAYKKFLSSGCTDAPVELLKIAGVDLTTAAPIQSALDTMEKVLGELEALV
mgnify:FL=1